MKSCITERYKQISEYRGVQKTKACSTHVRGRYIFAMCGSKVVYFCLALFGKCSQLNYIRHGPKNELVFGIWTWHWILGDSDKLLFSIAILWFIPAHHLPIWIPISVANDSAIVFSPNSLNLGAFFLLLWSHNCTWGTWRNKFQMIRGSDWKLSADPYPYLHNPPIRDCVS